MCSLSMSAPPCRAIAPGMFLDQVSSLLDAPVSRDDLLPGQGLTVQLGIGQGWGDRGGESFGRQAAAGQLSRRQSFPGQHGSEQLLTDDLGQQDRWLAGPQDRAQGAAASMMDDTAGPGKQPVVRR